MIISTSKGALAPLAPIALFVYNRPWHTEQTVEALKNNLLASKSDLVIYSDAEKTDKDKATVLDVRDYIKTITGFKSVTVIERKSSLGLAQSIINGVTDIIGKNGSAIVLEDDMVTSRYFLKFMNEALDLYKDEERVISIHGYVYPVQEILPETFFLRGADCWGWATWKRGWDLFESDGQKLLSDLRAKKLAHAFDFDGSFGYTKMLEAQIAGKNYSWAIRWYASAFLHNKLTLYPGVSLIANIGIDSSGAHCGTTDIFETKVAEMPVNINPSEIIESISARTAIKRYFLATKESTVRTKIRKALNFFTK